MYAFGVILSRRNHRSVVVFTAVSAAPSLPYPCTFGNCRRVTDSGTFQPFWVIHDQNAEAVGLIIVFVAITSWVDPPKYPASTMPPFQRLIIAVALGSRSRCDITGGCISGWRSRPCSSRGKRGPVQPYWVVATA